MDDDAALHAVLERARSLGFLGPGPVADHLVHARVLADVVGPVGPVRGLDLGSGGGVPGLALASWWPESRWTLLDAAERRTAALDEAVTALEMHDRVTVVRGRAEDVGRDPGHRGRYGLVVARSFGAPAVTAECGGAFLELGGRLVVAEPPDDRPDRWPAAGLAELGLAVVLEPGAARVAILQRVAPLEERWPRRSGVPAKRPLWRSR
ncbi:MAG TPA: RsmG family class I SAM-dependent methyltransferase [Acidimicrobiales bacterium]|nr:RsmG family class I SAM-dependent methyltransferase [Acidimicrobiales bacterium]